ncbi:MAG: hypothetical protein HY719_00690 [Planctomycetes bacterium]|nr:hypothetical protein [Planctomycetota bacterium]
MRVLVIAGSGSNCGKTFVAERLIPALDRAHRREAEQARPRPGGGGPITPPPAGVAVLKVTPWRPGKHALPFDAALPFQLHTAPEIIRTPGKDTARLLAAGAAEVAWLIAREERMAAGVADALAWFSARPTPPALLVVEGNSALPHARPDAALFVLRPGAALAPKHLAAAAGCGLLVVNHGVPASPARVGDVYTTDPLSAVTEAEVCGRFPPERRIDLPPGAAAPDSPVWLALADGLPRLALAPEE